MVPRLRGNLPLVSACEFGVKMLARPRHDDHAVLRITANVRKTLTELRVWSLSPSQRFSVSVKADLQNALVSFHDDVFVLASVLFQSCHSLSSFADEIVLDSSFPELRVLHDLFPPV